MNDKIVYQIEFYSYWHSGSGLSGSTYADSIVNKNENNLPFIPGKTIKGLLRDAAEMIHSFNSQIVTSEFITEIFGARAEEGNSDYTKEGKAFFTNASLSEELSKNIQNEMLTNELYTVISATRIDENGQADNGSLRQMEVTIPLVLYGSIEKFPDSKYSEQIIHCFNWIKQIGLNRNRGLGKCKFSVVKS